MGTPMMLSYQMALPSLPVPNLQATVERYLTSMQHLDEVEYDRLKTLSEVSSHALHREATRHMRIRKGVRRTAYFLLSPALRAACIL